MKNKSEMKILIKCFMACFHSKKYLFLLVICSFPLLWAQAQTTPSVQISKTEKIAFSQWENKRIAILGDSMTDKCRVGTTCVWWEYLCRLLDFRPIVYGQNGDDWIGIYQQVVKMHSELGNNIDAIFIFAGTNDYNENTPIGGFYDETKQVVNRNGRLVNCLYRSPILADSTFCGRINKVLSYIKKNYSTKQVVVMTPIHRGFAKFGEDNIQPDENYSNVCGLYIDAYVKVLKQASSNWSVPVIDLFSLSGLYPLYDSNMIYFHNAATDRLHPNANGDYRLAKTLQYQLLALPCSF